MHSDPSVEPLCGACAHFDPARHEPPGDVKYGYCKTREQLERDERGRAAGRLVDIATRCFMSRWHAGKSAPAFETRRERAR